MKSSDKGRKGSLAAFWTSILLHLVWITFIVQMLLSFMVKPSMEFVSENRLYYDEEKGVLGGVLLKQDGSIDLMQYGQETQENYGYAHFSQRRVTGQKYYQMFFPLFKYSSFSDPTSILLQDWKILKEGEQAYYIRSTQYNVKSQNLRQRDEEEINENFVLIMGNNYLEIGGVKFARQNSLPDWAEKIMSLGVEIAQMPTPEERAPLPNPIRYTDAYP